MRQLRLFFSNAAGATSIEYAMIGAVMAVGIVVGAATIGSNLSTKFYNAVLIGFQ
ncbi:MAG TPA: Flp family type IVb pilin [Lichenihabitans sp.]|jgi:pilus assembly protein Flp/PilA|nr:Flp family type IVb pilin [Lichenihabitans sp.]